VRALFCWRLPEQQLKDKLIERKQYIDKDGKDLPEIRNWKWDATSEGKRE